MSDDDNPLAGLIAFFFILYLVVEAVILIVKAIVLTVATLIAVGTVLVFFAALGVGANLLVRCLIGIWGDRAGDQAEAIAYRARIGLVVMMLAPSPILSWLPLVSSNVLWLWLLLLVVSTPAYYWAFFAHWVPIFHWENGGLRIERGPKWGDLPFRIDAAMRTEAHLVYYQFLILLHRVVFRVRLGILTSFGGGT